MIDRNIKQIHINSKIKRKTRKILDSLNINILRESIAEAKNSDKSFDNSSHLIKDALKD